MNIGKASDASGVSQRMIRHYETLGLIPAPRRRESGYRDYSDADVERLRLIAGARDIGFPIDRIGEIVALWDDGADSRPDTRALALALADEAAAKARAAEDMRSALISLADRCRSNRAPDCDHERPGDASRR